MFRLWMSSRYPTMSMPRNTGLHLPGPHLPTPGIWKFLQLLLQSATIRKGTPEASHRSYEFREHCPYSPHSSLVVRSKTASRSRYEWFRCSGSFASQPSHPPLFLSIGIFGSSSEHHIRKLHSILSSRLSGVGCRTGHDRRRIRQASFQATSSDQAPSERARRSPPSAPTGRRLRRLLVALVFTSCPSVTRRRYGTAETRVCVIVSSQQYT